MHSGKYRQFLAHYQFQILHKFWAQKISLFLEIWCCLGHFSNCAKICLYFLIFALKNMWIFYEPKCGHLAHCECARCYQKYQKCLCCQLKVLLFDHSQCQTFWTFQSGDIHHIVYLVYSKSTTSFMTRKMGQSSLCSMICLKSVLKTLTSILHLASRCRRRDILRHFKFLTVCICVTQ